MQRGRWKRNSAHGREIETRQKDLATREQQLSRDRAVMLSAEQTKAERELAVGRRDLECMRNAYLEDLNARRNEELGRLQGKLIREVQAHARAQGFDVVLGDGVLYAHMSLDLTDDALAAPREKGRK